MTTLINNEQQAWDNMKLAEQQLKLLIFTLKGKESIARVEATKALWHESVKAVEAKEAELEQLASWYDR